MNNTEWMILTSVKHEMFTYLTLRKYGEIRPESENNWVDPTPRLTKWINWLDIRRLMSKVLAAGQRRLNA